MKVYIAESQYSNSNKYDRIQALIDYVNRLTAGLYQYSEINPQAVSVYFIDYYSIQVNNGGHQQFFANATQFANLLDEVMNQSILQGLSEMGLNLHKKIFQAALEIMNRLPKPYRDVILFNPYCDKDDPSLHPNLKKALDYLSQLDAQFYANPPLIDPCYDYISKINQLEVVADEALENKIIQVLSEVPELEKRMENNVQDEPIFSKVAKALCQSTSREFLSFNVIDFGEGIVSEEQLEKNQAEGIFYCHVTTSLGNAYIVLHLEAKTAELFNAENHERLGSMDISQF